MSREAQGARYVPGTSCSNAALARDRTTLTFADEKARVAVWRLRARDALVGTDGPHHDVARTCAPTLPTMSGRARSIQTLVHTPGECVYFSWRR